MLTIVFKLKNFSSKSQNYLNLFQTVVILFLFEHLLCINLLRFILKIKIEL